MRTAEPLLVGVDVGTTRVKAGVINVDGTELALAKSPTVWRTTATGAEARPMDFLDAVRNVLAAALSQAPPGPIVGVGVASMAETAILLDAGARPLGPAVAWYDRRAQGDFEQLIGSLAPGEYGRRTGLGTAQIPTVATLHWLVRTYPELRRAAHALAVAEWVVVGLGGSPGAEPSLASRTGILQVASRRWWSEMLDWVGLSASLFGQLRPAGAPWGTIRRAGAGLERLDGAVLTVAGHDHVVAAIGCGVTSSSQAMDSCGTAEAVIRALPADARVDPSAGLKYGISTGLHVLPGFHSLLAGLPLGIELVSVLRELGASAREGRSSLDGEVLELLREDRPLENGSPAARRWHEALQAAVTRTLNSLTAVQELGGPLTEVRLSGGWAANPVLAMLKARALAHPVYPDVSEAGVRGAALLAGQAAGLFEGAEAFPSPPLRRAPVGSPLTREECQAADRRAARSGAGRARILPPTASEKETPLT
jgi:sugar (pentulose or hexulose) kinase